MVVNVAKLKDWLVIGAVGAGAYLAYRTIGAVGKVPAALKSAGEAVGSGLYYWFNPDTFGETTMHIVRFPDGQKHSVPSRAVDSTGTFTNRQLSPNYAGDGKRYTLVVEKSTGAYVAVPA